MALRGPSWIIGSAVGREEEITVIKIIFTFTSEQKPWIIGSAGKKKEKKYYYPKILINFTGEQKPDLRGLSTQL